MARRSATGRARPTISIFWNGRTGTDVATALFSHHISSYRLGWLVLASILGLAILVGLVRGTPLPSWVRLVHVHAALVGGVAQMILGGFLAFIPPLLMTGHKQRESYPVLFRRSMRARSACWQDSGCISLRSSESRACWS